MIFYVGKVCDYAEVDEHCNVCITSTGMIMFHVGVTIPVNARRYEYKFDMKVGVLDFSCRIFSVFISAGFGFHGSRFRL
jgi:hypothetical protein